MAPEVSSQRQSRNMLHVHRGRRAEAGNVEEWEMWPEVISQMGGVTAARNIQNTSTCLGLHGVQEEFPPQRESQIWGSVWHVRGFRREFLDTLLESPQVQSHAGTPEAGSSTGVLRHVSKGSGPDKGARGCGMHWSSEGSLPRF